MNLLPRPLPFDPAQMPGLSERLLNSHHSNNYQGALKRLNALRSELAAQPLSGQANYHINGLKREELIASNSVTLHELYFDSLHPAPEPMVPAMALALSASFGSVEQWQQEFAAMGKALGGGSGWVILAFDPRSARLINQWASDHTQLQAGSLPLLALDMYEHAYHLDFGANAGAYVDAFMQQIDWDKLYLRYQHAVHACSEGYEVEPDALGDSTILDVRRAGPFQQSAHMLPGARWQDPARVDEWAAELQPGQAVTVYCIYGHEVGRSTALRLRARGVDARFLCGGIDSWQAAGRPLVDK
ncbi:Fe-Mn family superoxide dismutase [Leeia aquatica]|uniref:superoxide dismutase n=1 Tax=Leeia aquatica TaxID=2725557 RepID=A0A847SAM8_9NEIS|nr:Fe-Mn family superoxide dismutase [Leeia aquatica]NLR74138.1 superoxide dismutase [Leeia aquatica]